MDLWTLLLLTLAVAIASGFLGSLAGLAGGIILGPILLLFLGVPFGYAVGASAVAALATSTTTGATYIRNRIADVRLANLLVTAAVPGAIAGAAITVALHNTDLVPILMVLLGVVLVSSIPGCLAASGPRTSTAQRPSEISRVFHLEGRYYDPAQQQVVRYTPQRGGTALGLMAGVGLVSGLFGIGAGILNVLVMDRVMGLPLKVATTTSNLMIGVAVMASVGVLFAGGLVLPELAAPAAIGTIVGALAGSRLLPRLSTVWIRYVFLGALSVLSVWIIYRGAVAL